MNQKIKHFYCSPDTPLGKAYQWAASAIEDTEIEIDVSDTNTLCIHCPCCTFWRGVLIGALVSGAIGCLLWSVL